MRVLTVTDLHQSRLLYDQLRIAVSEHKPDVVAFVGDFLDCCEPAGDPRLTPQQCARALSSLPTEHLIFVRGNHEDWNWLEFVTAWPFEQRPLLALYGTAVTIGPLVMVGFPCILGSEDARCETLPRSGNQLTLDPNLSGRDPLPFETAAWLPGLLRRVGPAGRTLWLVHEPPVAAPIADPRSCNPAWREAVEDFQPMLVVSGHDHATPRRTKSWHAHLDRSLCVNVGQSELELHYCVLDLEFRPGRSSLPTSVTVRAFPWRERCLISTASDPERID